MCFYPLVPLIWMINPVRCRVIVVGLIAMGCLITTLLVSVVTSGMAYVQDNTYLYYWFPTQAPVIITGLVFYSLCWSRLFGVNRRQAAGTLCRRLSAFFVASILPRGWI